MEDKETCRPSGDQVYEIEFDQDHAPKRQSWDVYFMNIAKQVATRGTCHRKHVGCVIVRDRTILATGYNGSVRGMPHCDEVGHMMENGHCTRTAHAEQNAITQAARYGVSVMEGEAYVTASPCWICFKIMANAGIKRIVFGEFYRDDRIFEAAEHIGLELALLDSNNELKVFVKGR
ncbi:MAG: deoxycytidylate deaminase [Thermoplasmatota archaeon]